MQTQVDIKDVLLISGTQYYVPADMYLAACFQLATHYKSNQCPSNRVLFEKTMQGLIRKRASISLLTYSRPSAMHQEPYMNELLICSSIHDPSVKKASNLFSR